MVRNVGGGMLLSILITVLIMGALGGIVLTDTGSPLSVPTTIPVPTTGQSTTESTQSPVTAAEQVACIQDADALSTALSDYQEVNGITLGVEMGIHIGVPSSYESGRIAQDLLGSTFLSSWPIGTGFALSVSTTVANDIAVYVPATSLDPVVFSRESATTGCNAL